MASTPKILRRLGTSKKSASTDLPTPHDADQNPDEPQLKPDPTNSKTYEEALSHILGSKAKKENTPMK